MIDHSSVGGKRDELFRGSTGLWGTSPCMVMAKSGDTWKHGQVHDQSCENVVECSKARGGRELICKSSDVCVNASPGLDTDFKAC